MQSEAMMKLALLQARRARGTTYPNPAVGAVVFRGKKILGQGFTCPAGGPHAEIVAMQNVARRHGAAALRGASIAITLEPCCHHGRTGPCAEALLAAGIRKVLVGCIDPNLLVRGKGVRRLKQSGVAIQMGVLEAECREMIRGFRSVQERGRPYLVLKLAASLDGRIATASGESRWITGEKARTEVHRLRARVDAVLVGSETALVDAPELTARRGARVVHRPVRVLVDSKFRVSPQAKFFHLPASTDGKTWVLHAKEAVRSRRNAFAALAAQGVRLLPVAKRGEHLDLAHAMQVLAQEGLTEILVEGGGELAAALLRAHLVDELHWFTAPKLIGGDGRAALGVLKLAQLADAVQFENFQVKRLGDDLYFWGTLRGGGNIQ